MADLRNKTVWIGAAASALWLLLVFLAWFWAPETGAAEPARNLGQRVISWAGVLAPLGLIWLVVWLREEIGALRHEAEGLRVALSAQRNASDRADPLPPIRATGATHASPPRPAPRSPAAARATDARQASLGLDQPQPPQIAAAELVLALNFPNGPDDHHTIAALRKSLQDPDLARLIRAAQDVVTLLASHGLYMDNLPPQADLPSLWRRYAAGSRGQSVAQLALAADEVSLQTAAKMLRWDEVFRDAAHHFLRQFDRLMSQAAQEYDDELLAALTDTRSGRAFTLLAQITGAVGERVEVTSQPEPQADPDQDSLPPDA